MSLKPFQSPQRRGVVCRTRSLGRAFQCHTASSVQRPQDSASITAWPACKTRMPIPGSNATCNSGACSCYCRETSRDLSTVFNWCLIPCRTRATFWTKWAPFSPTKPGPRFF